MVRWVKRVGVRLGLGLGLSLGFWRPAPAIALPHQLSVPVYSAGHLVETIAETTQFSSPSDHIDLDPVIIENSPVLQRWLEEIPNVLSDIESDPSFRTRFRLGYIQNWADNQGGFAVGVEDIFLGRSGSTLSGNYQAHVDTSDYQYGVDLRYYFLPLGNSVNLGPVVGYRHISREQFSSKGVNVGLRLVLVPLRTGSADLSATQTWVNPGSDRSSVSRFTLSAGYALTQTLRLSTDWHIETTEKDQATNVGILIEWML